jgi:uncharacterized protein (DUF2141 family)
MHGYFQRLPAALAGIALAFAALGASAQAPACHGTPSAQRVTIDVEGVHSARGFVTASIFGPDRGRFLKDDGAIFVWRDPAQRGVTTLCFFLPAPGPYAVVAFHDANANGRLDLGFLGVPVEGYGFSNNVRPVLHAPSFESVAFQAVAGDTRLHIRLRYP